MVQRRRERRKRSRKGRKTEGYPGGETVMAGVGGGAGPREWGRRERKNGLR